MTRHDDLRSSLAAGLRSCGRGLRRRGRPVGGNGAGGRASHRAGAAHEYRAGRPAGLPRVAHPRRRALSGLARAARARAPWAPRPSGCCSPAPRPPRAAPASRPRSPRRPGCSGLDIDDGTATVDLTSEYEAGGGSLSMTARLAQVVYTLTEFDTVHRVRFRLDGRPVDVFSGEGIVLDRAVGRKEYDELMPLIALDRAVDLRRRLEPGRASPGPRTSSRRTSRFASSTATVRSSPATSPRRPAAPAAAARSRCELPYRSATEQAGTIVVSDDDADGDGRPQHSVAIPVRLASA